LNGVQDTDENISMSFVPPSYFWTFGCFESVGLKMRESFPISVKHTKNHAWLCFHPLQLTSESVAADDMW